MTRTALLITAQYPPQPGGLARATRRNAQYIAEKYRLVLLNITDAVPPGRISRELDGEITVVRLGRGKPIAETLRLALSLIEDLHKEHDFSLFIGFYLVYAGYLAALCGARFRRPSFVSIRGNDIDTALFTAEHLPFVQWTLQHATIIGCVTKELREYARALSGRDDINYMPNGVDAQFWRPQPRDEQLAEALGIANEIVLGFVGELRQKKGPAAIIEAFMRLQPRFPAKLLLVGGARQRERERLDSFLAHHPRLAADIIALDYITDREEMRRYYALIDIVLLPSLWEGMSNVLLEALAMEKIVVASNVGGNGEVVEDGRSGFLIERACLPQLGGKLIDICQQPRERLREIATNGRRRVSAEFSLASEREKLLAALDRLLIC